MEDLLLIINKCEDEMRNIVSNFDERLRCIKIGIPNANIFDNISILCDGSYKKVKHIASINIQYPNLIYITPWEKNSFKAIEKAIGESSLNLTPQNDGKNLIFKILPPTKQQRLLLIKDINQINEQSKVRIRNVRKNYKDVLKKLLKRKDISSDQEKNYGKNIQEKTNLMINKLDKLSSIKLSEIKKL